ncbi:MAG: hypothetical protein K9H61_02280 [Bacteroidia bacterium]|nr:hypothetical protein [Bacteroidia bacterium]MCF8427153.1 hypothetical protein [Bacteroidia bacterium]MCF8445798.1 hypothetical protein [Bacteroidia bacterium]
MSNAKNSSGPNLATIILGGATLIGGYFLVNKSITDGKAQDEATKLVSDTPTKQASLINLFLGSLIQRPNTTELVALARSITDWPAVVKAYANLYKGENVEVAIREKLQLWGGYTDFLTALSKKGLPGTTTDNIVVQPKVTGNVKGDKLLLDDSKYDVEYYKNWQDYPVKKLATVPKGKVDPAKRTVTFQQAYEASYAGSSVKASLYQIALSNGLLVWVNRDRNIMKKAAVKGLAGAYANII